MSQPATYARSQIVLHWLIAVLIAVNYLLGDAMEEVARTVARTGEDGGFPTPHSVIGMVVLILVLVRIVLRFRKGAPGPTKETPLIMARLAHWGHLALYVLMIAVPITGVLAWGVGIRAMGDVHEASTTALLIFAAGHAAVAIYHHFVMKDGTLKRMSPHG